RVASCKGPRGRRPGVKTIPDRGLTSAQALQPLAQLRQKSPKARIVRGSLEGYASECRSTGKDNPSITSSSVTTWYLPAAIGGVTPLFRLVGPSFASDACWLISPFFATGLVGGALAKEEFLCHV